MQLGVSGAKLASGANPTPGLFFDLQADTLRANTKKAFAHYFPPYPVSIDNKDPSVDYYTVNYLNIHGESNTHQTYGGFLRNRPMGRAPLSGNWKITDIQTEINDARAAGLDGFVVDLLSSPSSPTNNWTQAVNLAQTASNMFPDGSFKVIPMVDTTASYANQAISDISDQLYQYFLTLPSSYQLPDGRQVVSSFKGEGETASWWDSLFTDLSTRHGVSCAFLGGYLNISQSANYSGYSWTYASGDWGDGADPGIASLSTGASDHSIPVRARNEKWMQPIQPENVRPDQHLFDEAIATGSLRGWWERAISVSADYVQIVTWSDYSESGSVANSVNSGNCNLDVSSYYLYKWKTGAFPEILTDAIYLSHRSHFSNATFQSANDGETTFMSHWARGRGESSLQDVVEVLTFLTAPASVTVSIGDTTQTFTAPAGMNVVYYPLVVGSVSVAAKRGSSTIASVTSTVAVTATPYKDEYVYYRFSSIRGTAGQYNPNLA